jgi:hypothetical protein
MRKGILIVGLLVLTLALVGALRRQTFMLESIADTQALWNEDELFVVVQRQVSVLRTTWLVRQITGSLGIAYPLPRDMPEDLIVIEIRDGQMRRQEFSRVGRIGNAFPHEGSLCFLRGTQAGDYPNLHRLDEGKLVRVPKADATSIVQSVGLESEWIKRQGWHKSDLYFTSGRAVCSVQLGTNLSELVLTHDRRSGAMKIELCDPVTQAGPALFELVSQRRRISENEYQELVGR